MTDDSNGLEYRITSPFQSFFPGAILKSVQPDTSIPPPSAALSEISIDISGHSSKHLGQFLDSGIEIVVTVCGNADQACPAFPGKVTRHHWGFEDPPKSIREGETEMEAFRRIHDQIRLVFEAYAADFREASS